MKTIKYWFGIFYLVIILSSCHNDEEVPFDDIIDVNVIGDTTFNTSSQIPVEVIMSAWATSESKMVKMYSPAGFFLDFADTAPNTGDTVMVDLRSKVRGDSICVDTLTLVADTVPGFFLVYAQTGGDDFFIARDTLELMNP